MHPAGAKEVGSDGAWIQDVAATVYSGYVACVHLLLPECGADNEDWDEWDDDRSDDNAST